MNKILRNILRSSAQRKRREVYDILDTMCHAKVFLDSQERLCLRIFEPIAKSLRYKVLLLSAKDEDKKIDIEVLQIQRIRELFAIHPQTELELVLDLGKPGISFQQVQEVVDSADEKIETKSLSVKQFLRLIVG